MLQKKKYTKLRNLQIKVKENISILLSICMAYVLIYIRYVHHMVPYGFDISIYYLYSLNWYQKDLMFGLLNRNHYHPLFLLFLWLLEQITKLPPEELFMSMPFIIATFYVTSFYYLLRSILPKEGADIAVLFSTLTSSFVRLSYDLLPNFSALIFFFIFLGYYNKLTRKSKHITAKDLLILFSLQIILVLIHIWVYLILLTIITVDISLYIMYNLTKIKEKKIVRYEKFILLYYLIPNYALIAIGIVSGLFNGVVKPIIPLSLPVGWDWFALKESSLVYILSITTFIILISDNIREKIGVTKRTTITLISWTISIALLVIVTSFGNTYRIYIHNPYNMFAGICIYTIYLKVKQGSDMLLKKKIMLNNNLWYAKRKIVATLFIMFTLLVSLNLILLNAYIPQYTYYPDHTTMKQIKWLHDTYGFSNKSVIFVVFNPSAEALDPLSKSHVEGWVRGYLGDSVYYGHLISLLYGMPDKYHNTFNYTNKKIIIADRLYTLSSLEHGIAKKISNLGIYEITDPNITIIDKFLENKGINVQINTTNFSASLNIDENCNLMIMERKIILNYSNLLQNQPKTISIKINKYPNNLTATYLFLQVSYPPTNNTLIVRTYDNKGNTVSSIKQPLITKRHNKKLWIVLPLKKGIIIAHLDFSVVTVTDKKMNSFKLVINKIIAI